ncbi:MAG: glycoside hydrolase, partial [Verrucomicrobiae bacterium]|nr:glycoside hydrolase [Verrucomicrobiae bacterium]
LIGLKPRADDRVEVNPTLPEKAWDWFCLDRVSYKGRILTILWDEDGKKYGKGRGLMVFANGKRIAHSPTLSKVVAEFGK